MSRLSARVSAILIASAVAACALPDPRAPTAPGLVLPNRLTVRTAGRVQAVGLEDYVVGSVLAEVTPVGEPAAAVARIYDVQAVIARTYAAAHLGRHRLEGFDLCDTTHCQLYDPARIRTSRFAGAARDAVRRTAGQVLTYGRRPVDALFHADCGGRTTAAEAVWGGRPLPYLLPMKDDVPALAHRVWQFDATGDAVRAALNHDARTAVGARLSSIDIVSRDDSGRAASVAVRGEREHLVRGEDFRAVLNSALGARAIQSTRFTLKRLGARYVFDGSGLGHGVGLCQAGAAARARRGDRLAEILAAYFSRAVLTRAKTR